MTGSTSLRKLFRKLIRAGAGRSYFILGGIGLCAAMLLLLAAVQVQADYNELLYGSANRDSVANFLVVNKQLTNNPGDEAITPQDLDSLRSQPFVEAAESITPSRFKATAQAASSAIPFSTDLYFESVSDTFLDVRPKEWKWNEQSSYIPAIIPNMFLDMYNFGFSASQGLPQITPDLVKNVPMQITIQSPAGPQHFYAKVVGFTDRIASVLVPRSFMDWANEHFGGTRAVQPSRAIVRTRSAGDPRLADYLSVHHLHTDPDKTRFSRYRQVVDMVVNVSGVTGGIMLLFALLVFTLFIRLTISSSRAEIALLVTLGAAPRQLSRFLMRMFFPIYGLVTLLSLVVIAAMQYWLHKLLVPQNIILPSLISIYTVGAGLLMLTTLWLVNLLTIRKYVRAKA